MMRATFASGLLLLVLLSSPAYGIVVAYEGFDYPNSSPLLHNRSGGHGWTTGWLDNDMDMDNSLTANDVSLTSPIFPFTPIGDHIVVASGGREANRFFGNAFDMRVDGTTFYGSLLMQKVADGGATNDTVEFRVITPTDTEGFRMGFGSDEGFFLDSGPEQPTTGPGTIQVGVNYFVVFKGISSANGPDQFFASLFDPSTPVPAIEPSTWDLTLEKAVNSNFSGVRIHTGTSAAGGLYDEIRIGQTWADVTSPTSFLLGDFNGSSAIDPGDLEILMSNLHSGNQYSQGDIDFNGVIDLRDYNAFRTIYTGAGFVLPGFESVPEPATVVVVSTLLLGLVVGRRVRKARRGMATLAIVAMAGLAAPGSANAQGVEYIWQPTSGEHNWNDPNNWLGNGTLVFVPDTSEAPGDTALFPAGVAGSTALVSGMVPRVGQLNMDGGTVRINQTGELETHVSDGTSGAVVLDTNGRLEVRDSGKLTVGTVLSVSGNLHVYGPSATVTVASDMLMNGGTLGAHITGGTHSAIAVSGIADLSGTLRVNLSGVTPTNGNSWNLVTANGGITRMFENIVVDEAPALARGLQYRAVQSGNTAQLEVGNTLVVTIDRQTGEATVENPIGSGITLASYALQSGSGSLNPAGLASLNTSAPAGTGWTPGPQTTSVVAEQKHNSTFTLGVGQSVSLGNPYALGVLPGDEDVAFGFTTTDGRVLRGVVEYVGTVNDFTLFINPATGEAAIGNSSSFLKAPNVTGYAILSSDNQLVAANWDSFQSSGDAGSGWVATPGSSSVLTETNVEDSHLFTSGNVIDLGAIFTANGNTAGLTFEYTVAGELAARTGTISLGPIPDAFEGLVGDYNGDNVVDAADYVVWRNNVGTTGTLDNDLIGGTVGGAHYLQWKANYGATGSGGLAIAAQPVSEPATVVVLLAGLVGAAAWRGRTIATQA